MVYKKQTGPTAWDIIEVGEKISVTEYQHTVIATFYSESKADEYIEFINKSRRR